jgi:hypothetical protein
MRLSGATTRDAVNDVTLTDTSVTQSWSKVTACRDTTAYCARLHEARHGRHWAVAMTGDITFVAYPSCTSDLVKTASFVKEVKFF